MTDRGAFGSRLGGAFRREEASALVTRALRKSTLAVTELRCDRPNFGRTLSIPPEDAWLVGLQLRACPDHDLYFEGRRVRPVNFRAGVTTIYDLRRDPVADIRDPYHCLMLYLPRSALLAMARKAGARRPGDLRHNRGEGINDPVVRHLLSSLLPAMAKPRETDRLFIDHVILALTSHIAFAYAGMEAAGDAPGRLAPWQVRRVTELMTECPEEDLTLAELANECRLSVRHFVRLFRQSTGTSPHQWLLRRRVDRAIQLIRDSDLPLSAISLACGFADQSHFTRVFHAVAGVSPGEWRRQNRARNFVS